MTWIEAVILGIVQGLTEFLPVSSSGHIVLGEALLQTGSADNLAFTVVVHFATVLSTLIVFRKSIWKILSGLRPEWNYSSRFLTHILISMIPVAIAGLFFKDEVEALFQGRTMLVGFMLLITGSLLLLTSRAGKGKRKITTPGALLIGISQALAVIPGISRSGATISTALLLGVDREKAAEFSFLMVIPPILGIMLLDLKDIMELSAAGSAGISSTALFAGFLAAFLTGLAACSWMISIVKKGRISYFAYYCFAIGIIAIAVTCIG